MAAQFVQHEGVAIVEMELRVTDTRTVPIVGNTVLLSRADITETSDGFSNASFTIVSASRDYVDKLLKETMANQTPRMRWRLGIGFPQGSVEFIPWQEHVITAATHSLEGLGDASTGYVTILQTADLLWEINRINRTASRKGKISDIVKQIADSYKIDSIIETTKTTGQYYQSFISDYQFIRNRMVFRAVNDKNRGNYQFFVRDGVLHFHTIDYQAELKNFLYYASPGTKLTVQDHSQEMITVGAGGASVVFYDPYTGESGAALSEPENTLRLGNTAPDLTKLEGARKNILLHLGTNRSVDATSISANTFEAAKTNIYALSLMIPKTLYFRASDLCRVTIQPDSREVPPSSGIYQVYKVHHVVDKATLVSEVTFRRGEFFTKDKTQVTSQSSETIIQPPRGAPGQDPNLKSVSSSVLTKGIGTQTGGSTVVETQDPNKAP